MALEEDGDDAYLDDLVSTAMSLTGGHHDALNLRGLELRPGLWHPSPVASRPREMTRAYPTRLAWARTGDAVRREGWHGSCSVVPREPCAGPPGAAALAGKTRVAPIWAGAWGTQEALRGRSNV
jgi:hypothetical protein